MLLRSLEHRRRQHTTGYSRVPTLLGYGVVIACGGPDRPGDRPGRGIFGASRVRSTGGACSGDQQDALWFVEKDQRFVGETLYAPLTVLPCASAASVRLAFRASASPSTSMLYPSVLIPGDSAVSPSSE